MTQSLAEKFEVIAKCLREGVVPMFKDLSDENDHWDQVINEDGSLAYLCMTEPYTVMAVKTGYINEYADGSCSTRVYSTLEEARENEGSNRVRTYKVTEIFDE